MNELTHRHTPTSLDRIRSEIDTTFDRWLKRFGWPEGRETFGPPVAFGDFSFSGPAVDLEEDEKELRVTAELPGLDPKDFKVELEGQRLLLRGEKKAEREQKQSNRYYAECSYGSFLRTIDLPAEVDPAKVKAQYKDGVLRIHLPKTASGKAKAIKVEAA